MHEEKPVKLKLRSANAIWNYLSESIERVIFKEGLSKDDKDFILFSKRKLKQIKAMLVNIETLISEKEPPLMLEKNICDKLEHKIDEMRMLALNLDKIYLK